MSLGHPVLEPALAYLIFTDLMSQSSSVSPSLSMVLWIPGINAPGGVGKEPGVWRPRSLGSDPSFCVSPLPLLAAYGTFINHRVERRMGGPHVFAIFSFLLKPAMKVVIPKICRKHDIKNHGFRTQTEHKS